MTAGERKVLGCVRCNWHSQTRIKGVADVVVIIIGVGSAANAIRSNHVVFCARIVVVATRSRLRPQSKVIGIAHTILIAVGEGTGAGAIGLNQVIHRACVVVVAR